MSEGIGESVGYRTPVIDEAEETPVVEATPVSPEAITSMGQDQLMELIQTEGLDIDPTGMTEEELRYAVAQGVGLEVVDEGEDEEGEQPRAEDSNIIERSVRAQLEKEYGDKLREAQLVQEKARILDLIESDPETYIRKMADHFGVGLSAPAGPEPSFELPKIEPKPDEDMASYMQRVMTESLKALAVQAQKQQAQVQQKPKVNPSANRTQEVIGYLEKTHPDYNLYIDEMIDILKTNPQLSTKPWDLYAEAKRARETKRKGAVAKKIVQRKGETRTGERSTKPMRVAASVKGPVSFEKAWEQAKAQVKAGKY